MSINDDPTFTGSCTSFEPKAHFRLAMPAVVNVKRVDCYTNGCITKTYYDWNVDMGSNQIAHRDVYKNPPRTAKAAAAQGKRAARAYAEYMASRVAL